MQSWASRAAGPPIEPEVEPAVRRARRGDLRAAVALRQHHQRAARRLELLDVGVHPPGGRRPERARRVALGRLRRARRSRRGGRAGRRASARPPPAARRSSRARCRGPPPAARSATPGSSPAAPRAGRGSRPSAGSGRSRTTSPASSRCSSVTSGRNRAGSRSSCSRNTPSGVIFALACRSAEHDTAIADRHRRPVPGQPDHPDVVAEVLAAELRTDAEPAGQLQHLLLQVPVAEGVPEPGARTPAACPGSAPTPASRP